MIYIFVALALILGIAIGIALVFWLSRYAGPMF